MILENMSFNVIPSPLDKRDYKVPISGISVDDFVVGGSIEKHKTYDQLQTSMCTSFSIASAQEFWMRIGKRMSKAFLYGNRKEGEYMGEGEYIRESILDIYRSGNCFFDEFPFLGTTLDCVREFNKLPQRIKDSALNNRVEYFYNIPIKDCFEVMKKFDLPLVAGVLVYNNWTEAFKNGGVIPQLDGKEGNSIGGHAIRLLGKKTINGKVHFIVGNSWGKSIADNGVFYIPHDYKGLFEAWLMLPHIKKEIKLPIGKNFYQINGKTYPMDTTTKVINGRTYVPLRFFTEALGALEVKWVESSSMAMVYIGGDLIRFIKDRGYFSSDLVMEDVFYDQGSKNIIEDNRMLVPLRNICEFLNLSVSYDSINNTAIVKN